MGMGCSQFRWHAVAGCCHSNLTQKHVFIFVQSDSYANDMACHNRTVLTTVSVSAWKSLHASNFPKENSNKHLIALYCKYFQRKMHDAIHSPLLFFLIKSKCCNHHVGPSAVASRLSDFEQNILFVSKIVRHRAHRSQYAFGKSFSFS